MARLTNNQVDDLLGFLESELNRTEHVVTVTETCCGAVEFSPARMLRCFSYAFSCLRGSVKQPLQAEDLISHKKLWERVHYLLWEDYTEEPGIIRLAFVAKTDDYINPGELGVSLALRFNAAMDRVKWGRPLLTREDDVTNRDYHDAVDLLRFLGFTHTITSAIRNPNSNNFIEVWTLLEKA